MDDEYKLLDDDLIQKNWPGLTCENADDDSQDWPAGEYDKSIDKYTTPPPPPPPPATAASNRRLRRRRRRHHLRQHPHRRRAPPTRPLAETGVHHCVEGDAYTCAEWGNLTSSKNQWEQCSSTCNSTLDSDIESLIEKYGSPGYKVVRNRN